VHVCLGLSIAQCLHERPVGKECRESPRRTWVKPFENHGEKSVQVRDFHGIPRLDCRENAHKEQRMECVYSRVMEHFSVCTR
jgi:hypothetical protein